MAIKLYNDKWVDEGGKQFTIDENGNLVNY